MTEEYRPRVCPNSIPLMLQLAKMAGMEFAPIKKMTLVLDCEAAPLLYVESFLDDNKVTGVTLEKTKLSVISQKVEVKDTTSMQNELFRTYSPVDAAEPKQDA